MRHPRTPLALLGCLLVVLVAAGCASGPRYGSARKSRKGCDCPHWNALPKRGGERAWSPGQEPAITASHAARH